MIEIQVSHDRVACVRIHSSSSIEEDRELIAWRKIRDLIETANLRLQRLEGCDDSSRS